MFMLNDTSKVYIACPANYASGGPELLHQLGYILKLNNIDVSMLYIDAYVDKLPVADNYRSYNIPYITTKCIDSYDNIVIFPETMTQYLYDYHNIQKVIWWLSVDAFWVNSFIFFNRNLYLRHPIIKAVASIFAGVAYWNKLRRIKKDKKIQHFAQSHYAYEFLQKQNINNISYLSDYLRDEFIAKSNKLRHQKKENIVLFNPQKGIKFTNALIKRMPEVRFVPLNGLSVNQMIELLSTAKVYIDFGHHPGKDRIPREAAVMGAVVITNKQGSAKYYKDVAIDDRYKIGGDIDSLSEVQELILDVFLNYEQHKLNFQTYIDIILNEKNKFISDVSLLFNLNQ